MSHPLLLRRLGAVCVLIVAASIARPGAQTPAPAPLPQQPFAEFLDGIRTEALAKGISAKTIDRALAGVEPAPAIINSDRSQPELVLTLDQYLDRQMTAARIQGARDAARDHATLLKKVEAKYDVPPPMLVAVWGAESNFGKITGTRPIITALATLAWDGRRALFRAELFSALTILDRGHIALEDLKGSWAGAMGQPQFLPSSYLKYAVDFDGDGRADIWQSQGDVLASMANYLKGSGWIAGERWGREVKISRETLEAIDAAVPKRTTGCKSLKEMTEARPLADWRKLGVTLPDGAELPAASFTASLVRGDKRHFLVYPNYHALLAYNCSNSYAIGIGLLSDAVVTASSR